MKLITSTLLLVAVILTSSCGYEEISKSFIPEKESNFAKEYLHKLIEGDFEYVKSFLAPELQKEVTDDKLRDITSYFPKGELLSTEIMGSQVHTFKNGDSETWQGNFSFEYEFEEGWAVANVVMKRVDGNEHVVGFNIYPTTASQKVLNAFTFTDKSFLHYFILLFAIAVPIFIVVTLVFCIKTPIRKRKWLWIIFVLMGFVSLSINWTNGIYEVRPLYFHLLGAGFTKAGPHAPWVLTTSIPLGAIVFWITRRKFLEHSVECEDHLEPDAEIVDSVVPTEELKS